MLFCTVLYFCCSVHFTCIIQLAVTDQKMSVLFFVFLLNGNLWGQKYPRWPCKSCGKKMGQVLQIHPYVVLHGFWMYFEVWNTCTLHGFKSRPKSNDLSFYVKVLPCNIEFFTDYVWNILNIRWLRSWITCF